jgi:hypothetical protein
VSAVAEVAAGTEVVIAAVGSVPTYAAMLTNVASASAAVAARADAIDHADATTALQIRCKDGATELAGKVNRVVNMKITGPLPHQQ